MEGNPSYSALVEGLLSFALYLLLVSTLLPGAYSSTACGPEVGLKGRDCAQLWAVIGTAAWLPLALVARALLGPSPLGLLWSVVGRLPWRLLSDALLVTLIVILVTEGGRYLLATGVGVHVEASPGEPEPLVLGLLPHRSPR